MFPRGNAPSPTRIQRLARAVGVAPSAFGEHRSLEELRATAARVGGGASSTAMLATWRAGNRDDWQLDCAARAGVPVDELLGTHENVISALHERLRSVDGSWTDADARQLTERVALALDPATWEQTWRRWVELPRPGALVHVARLFPAGVDLAPARRAFLDTAQKLGADMATSVVHFIDAWQSGVRDGLVDWAAEESASRRDLGGQRRVLRLRCGVHVRADALDSPRLPEPIFSARELLRRDTSVTTVSGLADAPAAAATAPFSTRSTAWFPALDGLLSLLGDLVRPGWSPPAWSPGAEPVHVAAVAPWAALWEAAPLLGERVPLELLAGVVGLPPSEPAAAQRVWVEAASTQVARLARQRWGEGLRALARVAASERRHRRSFRGTVLDWIRDPVTRDRPKGRCRCSDGPFEIDLAGRAADVRLLTHAAACVGLEAPLLTWILNEWREATEVLSLLDSPGAELGRTHGSFAPLLRDALGVSMTPAAFRTAVSEAGRTPWCLDEADRAARSARPEGTPLSQWLSECASRVLRLPSEPWSRGYGCGADRDLRPLLETFRGTP